MKLNAEKISDHLSSLVIVVAICCVCALGVHYTSESIAFVNRGVKAPAKFTRKEKYSEYVNGEHRSGTIWHVTYQTADGTQQPGTVSAALWDDFKVGDEVEVIYDPDKPGSVKINNILSLWIIPILFAIPIPFVLGFFIRKYFKWKAIKKSKPQKT